MIGSKRSIKNLTQFLEGFTIYVKKGDNVLTAFVLTVNHKIYVVTDSLQKTLQEN